MPAASGSDKNVFRLRGQLSRLTDQVSHIKTPANAQGNQAPSPEELQTLSPPQDEMQQPVEELPIGQELEQCADSQTGSEAEKVIQTEDSSANTQITSEPTVKGLGSDSMEQRAELPVVSAGLGEISSGDTDDAPQDATPASQPMSPEPTKDLSAQLSDAKLQIGSLRDEVYALKTEKFHLLSAIRDFELEQLNLLNKIEQLESRPSSSQSPTRSEVRRENAVLNTRLCNFEEQLGESRAEMQEELQLAAGDHSLMAEELGLAIQAHKKAEQDLEQLQLMLAEEVKDKETKLAQAKECVNDVKDVVEILAKQLNDNQLELEQERKARAEDVAQLEAQRKTAETQAKEVRLELTETEEIVKALSQTNNELAAELEQNALHSDQVGTQLETELNEEQQQVKRLTAELTELRKEIQSLTIQNANAAVQQQELKDECLSYQKREESLGQELVQLTNAVDDRIGAYQTRELELQQQLKQMTRERDEALRSAIKPGIPGSMSMTQASENQVERLKHMASWIEIQQADTLKALEDPHSLEVKRGTADSFNDQLAIQEPTHETSELEMENAVMKDALSKLRTEFAVLKADKDEAVVQAEAIRGVLRKELDSLETELQKALEERSRLLASSSPNHVQELEAQIGQLKHDLEVSVSTVSSLDAALHREQKENEVLTIKLQTLENDSTLQAKSALQVLDSHHDFEQTSTMIRSLFSNVRDEVVSQHDSDEALKASLRMVHDVVSSAQSNHLSIPS